MKPIKIIPKSEAEWLKIKEGTIGASEIITACGLNPWKSPYELWLEKTKRKEADDINDSMILGKLFEAPLVDFWAIKTDHRPLKGSHKDILYLHPEKPYLSCTPDRFFWHSQTGEKWLCEVKNPDNRRVDEPEQSWIMQLQYQMGITGVHKGMLLWSYPQRGVYFMEQEYDFNQELFDMMVDIADTFWNENVLKDIEPDMTTGDDVLYKYPIETEGLIKECSESLADTYNEMVSLRDIISDSTKSLDKLKSDIKIFMQDAAIVRYLEKTLFTWKANKNGTRIFKIMG